MHGIGIHDPRHGLLVGIDVGRGHVFFRADELDELRGVAARHALQLTHRHFVRIANHSTLGSAEWNIHDGAFPGHPTSKGANFIEGHIRCITDSAFCRAASNRVLHPEPGKDFQLPVVH